MCRFALYAYRRVFPVPETVDFVYIFVRKINAARERRFAVYNGDFAVGAVVHAYVERGLELVEYSRFYARVDQLFVIVPRQSEQTPYIVVYNANVNARRGFAGENVENRVPALAALYYEILHEYIVLGFFEVFD